VGQQQRASARQTLADKSRAYAIALTECCEACAAVEIAGALGACAPAHFEAVVRLGVRVKNVLSRVLTAFLTTNEDQIRGLRFRPSS
jgi:hypothetical protein